MGVKTLVLSPLVPAEDPAVTRYYGPLCAELYDLTKPVGGDYPDVPYYLRHLTPIGGRVLEAAVGTGRLLVPLLRAGLQVDGIDASTEMLTCCRRNCATAGLQATLYCGALETMDLPHRYHAIVISFGSFMLLSSPGEATAALERMKRHLVPGGRLFLDVDAPGAGRACDDRESRQVAHCLDGSLITMVNAPARSDATGGIERRVLTFEKSKNGQVIAREVQDFSLRQYECDDLRVLLREAGFVAIDVCGDYVEEAAAVTATDWLCFRSNRPQSAGGK